MSTPTGEGQRSTVSLDPRSVRRAALTLAVVIAVYQVTAWAVTSLSTLLLDLLIAWLISTMIDPVVSGLARRGWRRGAATGLVLGGLTVTVLTFLVLLGRATLAQVEGARVVLPELVASAADRINTTFGTSLDPSSVLEGVDPTTIAGIAGGGVLGFATQFLGGLVSVLTIAVFSFYLSADAPRVQRFTAALLRPRHQVVFLHVWDIAVAKAGGFLLSKSVLAAISAAAHCVAFWAIGVPYWLPLGLFAGVVSQFIPSVGTYVGVAVPVLFTLFEEPWDAVWVIVFATVYQQIENYILTPRIARATMNMHPGVALGSVLAGAALLGPVGALLGIPLAAIALAIVEAYGTTYELHPQVQAATGPELS